MSFLTDVPRRCVDALAPNGILRAAINFGNPILASRCSETGVPQGISVDISRELAARLGVGLELVLFDAAGKVVEAVASDGWDVAFLAIDPERAREMAFTGPYILIAGSYAVRKLSAITTNDEVDAEDVHVVVGLGSAYDLFLSRSLKRAEIVRADTSPAVVDLMVRGGFDVAAGVRQQLQFDLQDRPELRLLDGYFMTIHQAMAIPRGRQEGLEFLRTFVDELILSGFIQRAVMRHGSEGALVAAPRA